MRSVAVHSEAVQMKSALRQKCQLSFSATQKVRLAHDACSSHCLLHGQRRQLHGLESLQTSDAHENLPSLNESVKSCVQDLCDHGSCNPS